MIERNIQSMVENKILRFLKQSRIASLGFFEMTAVNSELVVSETDVSAAVTHIKSLPYSALSQLPLTWGAQQFLVWLRDALPKKLKVGDSFQIGSGVYGHVVPLGADFLDFRAEGRLQIIISIRSWNTDLIQLHKL